MLVPFVSSACAVETFELFKLTGIDLYMEATQSSYWGPFVLMGAIASVFNAVGLFLPYQGLVVPEAWLQLLVRYMVDDILGLFFALVV